MGLQAQIFIASIISWDRSGSRKEFSANCDTGTDYLL